MNETTVTHEIEVYEFMALGGSVPAWASRCSCGWSCDIEGEVPHDDDVEAEEAECRDLALDAHPEARP